MLIELRTCAHTHTHAHTLTHVVLLVLWSMKKGRPVEEVRTSQPGGREPVNSKFCGPGECRGEAWGEAWGGAYTVGLGERTHTPPAGDEAIPSGVWINCGKLRQNRLS